MQCIVLDKTGYRAFGANARGVVWTFNLKKEYWTYASFTP